MSFGPAFQQYVIQLFMRASGVVVLAFCNKEAYRPYSIPDDTVDVE